jgi:hypothetical protein
MPSCHILALLLLLLQMLKHVHLSPYRSSMMSHHAGGGVGSGGRSDTLSLNSTMSCSSLSNQDPLSSRSSSYTSLNESSHNLPQHPPSPMVRKKTSSTPFFISFFSSLPELLLQLGSLYSHNIVYTRTLFFFFFWLEIVFPPISI